MADEWKWGGTTSAYCKVGESPTLPLNLCHGSPHGAGTSAYCKVGESPTLLSLPPKHLVAAAQLERNQLIWLTNLRAEPGALLFYQMIGVLHNRWSQCFALNLAA
jgi:hypothetical protein